jgi:hypothetical protein
MKAYRTGRLIPNAQTYGNVPSTGPVAQQTEHAPPKRGVAGAIPAGVTAADKLRLAAQKNQAADRLWAALRARLDFIQEMVDAGVPRDIAFQGEERLNRAKRLPKARRARACAAVAAWMFAQKMAARRGPVGVVS